MYRVVLLAALCAQGAMAFVGFAGNLTMFGANPAVTSLDIASYTGLWYQMSADAVVYNSFEKDAQCVTATYGSNADGTISVLNYASIGSPNGADPYVINGYAYVPDASQPGQLKVHFDSSDAAPFDAPYWVLALGPVNPATKLYDWAIVSDNLSYFLFVLARDVATFNTVYRTEVMSLVTSLGFTGHKAPIETYQGTDCVYGSASRLAAIKKQEQQLKAEEAKGLTQMQTVTSLDIPAFMDLWYQMYGNAFVFATTSGEAPSCATAAYALKSDATISVHNYEISQGKVMTIDGYAYQPDATKPGQLKLHIDSVPADGPYWILALGPIVNGFYDWAVVSDPLGASLFVLARDPATYKAKYDDEVMALVASLGFTKSMNKPLPVPQGGSCTYEA